MDFSFNSPSKTAALLLCNMLEYQAEKSLREVSRYRFSYETLSALSKLKRLTPEYLKDLAEVLMQLGYIFVDLGGSFCILSLDKVKQWSKLAYKRVEGLIDSSEEEVFARLEELQANAPSFEEEP